ncbi:hypothetical protein Pint_11534 [Pistacia integerrima]|uniref:Uncharacterized protein n=1 Tax=Pistacia integerrima TaxID=434235 RepID=A0ACC0XK45_9ROSI|nr:hypothetical protein Pint_11534 [Pistacia integerrima]
MILVELLVLYLIPKNWQLVMMVCFLMDNLTLNVQNTSSQVTGTTGPKLYQSSRQSSGSLRFYGLSLDSGFHNVSLSFAVTVFGDQGSQKWMSLGRRVFYIYIQLKDFDISTGAGGERKAITNKFNANVSENYLEIHLFWAGKGTCCIPDQDFTPTVRIGRKKKKSGLIVGIAVALGSLVLIGIGPKLKIFSYAELRSATEDFDRPNKLGQSGFGAV